MSIAVKKVKFKSLDAFRGLAALVIVMYHSAFYADTNVSQIVQNGGVFVDFFFILSGFVMAYSYQDKIGKSISFRKFFLLRVGRLYPLHIFVLLLWIPYIGAKVYVYQHGMGATDPLEINNFSTLTSNLFLMQGLGIDGAPMMAWNFPSWSISTEFYTYLVFFIVSVLFSFRKRSIYNIFIPLSTILLLYFTYDPNIGEYSALSFVRCLGGFFGGVVVYNIYKKVKFNIENVAYATFLEIIVLSSTLYLVQLDYDYTLRYLTIFAFMVVIYLFSIQNIGAVSRILEMKLPQLIGKLSYSIYMMHALIMVVAFNVFQYIFKFETSSIDTISTNALIFDWANVVNFLLIVLVVLSSWFTYKWIEIPWQKRFREYANK